MTHIVFIASKNIWYFTSYSNMCLFSAPSLNIERFLSETTTKIKILQHNLLKLKLLTLVVRIVSENIWYFISFSYMCLFCTATFTIARLLKTKKKEIEILQHNL